VIVALISSVVSFIPVIKSPEYLSILSSRKHSDPLWWVPRSPCTCFYLHLWFLITSGPFINPIHPNIFRINSLLCSCFLFGRCPVQMLARRLAIVIQIFPSSYMRRILPQIRPRSLPSTSISTHYPLIILYSDAVHTWLPTASFNNHNKAILFACFFRCNPEIQPTGCCKLSRSWKTSLVSLR
jgi:hypothetical protein